MMNPAENMGIRIGQLRRERGLTQEKLAGMLGISPQAVSKWETGLGCPDITLLPQIAQILETSLNDLFGVPEPEKKAEPAEDTMVPVQDMSHAFPGAKDGLKLAAVWGNVACYAGAVPARVEGPVVTFADGSEANLAEGSIVNNGGQEIRLAYADERVEYRYLDAGEVAGELMREYPGVHSLEVRLRSRVECTIRKGTNGVSRIKAQGREDVLKSLAVTEKDGVLQVERRELIDTFTRSDDRELLRLEIDAGFAEGQRCTLSLAGSGSIECEPGFLHSSVSIAGSGDINLEDAGMLKAEIAGSGDIDFRSARDAELSIAGSGDIDGEQVEGKLTARVAGSGDISVNRVNAEELFMDIAGSGDISFDRTQAQSTVVRVMGSGDISLGHGAGGNLELQLNGSGSLCAENITFADTDIRLDGTSEATIGCITGRSRERVARTARLQVLQRG